MDEIYAHTCLTPWLLMPQLWTSPASWPSWTAFQHCNLHILSIRGIVDEAFRFRHD